MPEYSFICTNKKCKSKYSFFSSIANYKPITLCNICLQNTLVRDYQTDLPVGAVKKNNDEITVGHLAHRNTEKMSEDEKESRWIKDHSYMEHPPTYEQHKRAMESQKNRKEMKRKMFGEEAVTRKKRKKNGK